MNGKSIHFNGVNGATGGYLLPAKSAAQVVGLITGADQHEDNQAKNEDHTLTEKYHAQEEGVLGVIEGVDAENIEEAKWGIVYPKDVYDDAEHPLRKALASLKDLRKGQELYREPGETSRTFRARYGQGPDVVDPALLPYYLLIAAPPTEIPYSFQYGLDKQHAVGRLFFDGGDMAPYQEYVKNVLSYESATGSLPRERRVAVFSTEHDFDEPTGYSTAYLANPLAKDLDSKPLKVSEDTEVTYRTEHVAGQEAKRLALLGLLTRTNQQPALVLTATHGVGFPTGHDLQKTDQGALLCAEWPGPGPQGWPQGQQIPDSMYLSGRLSGDHFPSDARVDGLIVFAFACYSCGTPNASDFAHLKRAHNEDNLAAEIPDQPFVASLPQRLLAQGALAFVGHVDRAWACSFYWKGVGRTTQTVQSSLEAMLKGKPVGHAMEYFNMRAVYLSDDLSAGNEDGILYAYNLGDPIDDEELAELWLARNDARAYVVFGDPAVRLKPELMPPCQEI